MSSKKKNPVGRPRVRPEGTTGVRVPLTNSEREKVKKKAKSCGQSAAQWSREVLVAAANS